MLPETGFLRIKEVVKFIPMGQSTIWAAVKEGKFPKPIKLSARVTVWRAEDIKAFIESKKEDADAEQDN